MGTATHPQRGEFRNEPYTDFSKPENRKAMEQALEKVKGELGREYPILIGGEEIRLDEKMQSVNPSHPEQIVGVFQKGTPELAHPAALSTPGSGSRPSSGPNACSAPPTSCVSGASR